MKKDKNIKKLTWLKGTKFIAPRVLYFLIGVFLAVSVYSLQAWEWDDKVSGPNTTLTPEMWNDLVAKLNDLDTRIASVDEVVCAEYFFNDHDGDDNGTWDTPSCPTDHPLLKHIKVISFNGDHADYYLTCCGLQ